MDLLWAQLHQTGTATLSSKAIIAGRGGIGKTTLALEYAHEALENKAYNLIYWIQAGTELSLLKGYKELLLEIIEPEFYLSVKDADTKHITRLFKDHMPKKGRSLFIYDNVPANYGDVPAPIFLKDMLPKNAHILLTSQCNKGWESPPLILDEFGLEDSVQYLLNVTGLEPTLYNRQKARKLAKTLLNFPLALAHAAHYLKLVGGKKVSTKHFKEYLKGLDNELQKDSLEHFEKNRNFFKEEHSKITYEALIGKTFRMSERFLTSKLAKELLLVCAYLNSDSIEEDIFLEYWYWLDQKKLEGVQTPCPVVIPEGVFLEADNKKEEFKEALAQLSALSLIKKEKDNAAFSVHALLQSIIRNENTSNRVDKKIFQHLASIFNTLFEKNVDTENKIEKISTYVPHMLQLLQHSKNLKIFPETYEELNQLEWIGKVIFFNKTMNMTLLNPNISDNQLEKMGGRIFSKKILDFLESEKESVDIPLCLGQIFEKSHPRIQLILACMYSEGFFVNKDDDLARLWCTQAVEQGYALAEIFLGRMHHEEKNYAEAKNYYLKAAKQGLSQANAVLGEMYLCGEGVEHDITMAVKYFKKAAKRGDSDANYKLGMVYGEAYKDTQKSLEYYKSAAGGGHKCAQLMLGLIDLKGRGVCQNTEEVLPLLTLSEEQGVEIAERVLGDLFAEAQDEKNAIKWYIKAAEDGDVQAKVKLASICLQQEDLEHDQIAFDWLFDAALLGHTKSQVAIGVAYKIGAGVEKNAEEALIWLTKAARKGDVEAKFQLGDLYCHGDQDVPQNHETAFELIFEAASQGHVKAQFRLGVMYDKNNSKVEAFKWLTKAAEQGHRKAQTYLREIDEKELLREQLFSPKFDRADRSNMQDKIKHSYNAKGNAYFSLSAQYAKEGYTDLAESFAIEASIMYELADAIQLTEGFQEEGVQWHLEMIRFNDKDRRKEPLQEQLPLKIVKKAKQPEVTQQSPMSVSLTSQPFIGKGKEEIGATPLKIHRDNKENFQEQLSPEFKVRVDKLAVKVTQQPIENSIQNGSSFALQGAAYLDVAILQHLEEGNIALAEHLAEEANKKYALAEDAQLAKKIHEENNLATFYEGIIPESHSRIAKNSTETLQEDPKGNK